MSSFTDAVDHQPPVVDEEVRRCQGFAVQRHGDQFQVLPVQFDPGCRPRVGIGREAERGADPCLVAADVEAQLDAVDTPWIRRIIAAQHCLRGRFLVHSVIAPGDVRAGPERLEKCRNRPVL